MENWKKIRLGSACRTNTDSYSPKEKWDFVNYLDTGNITNNTIDSIQFIDLTKDKLPSRAKRKVKMDSIVYSTVRPNQHHFGIIKSQPENFLVSTGFAVIDVDTNVLNADFLYYLLTQNTLVEALHAIAEQSTSAYPSIKLSDIENLEIEIPGILTQKKIADILNSLDGKVTQNNEINKNLEQQIEAVLLSFIENTNSNPVKLGDYLYIKGRIGWKGLKKNEYLEHSDYRIINGESLTKAGIDWSKAGYISQARYDESPEIMLQNGDILLSKDGTIGKIGYIDSLSIPTTVASGIFVIRNLQPNVISTTFIYYLLKSRLFTAFIAARTEGSVIPHLYQKDFMKFEFLLPNKGEMEDFEALTAPMFSLIISNLNENNRLSRIRDTLLPRLMSGELDVSSIDL